MDILASRKEELLKVYEKAKPRALLFDLAEGQPDFTVVLLREQPSLLLIGVDPSSDELAGPIQPASTGS
jgi:hypothetical protein